MRTREVGFTQQHRAAFAEAFGDGGFEGAEQSSQHAVEQVVRILVAEVVLESPWTRPVGEGSPRQAASI